jgi:hypothetical protein
LGGGSNNVANEAYTTNVDGTSAQVGGAQNTLRTVQYRIDTQVTFSWDTAKLQTSPSTMIHGMKKGRLAHLTAE